MSDTNQPAAISTASGKPKRGKPFEPGKSGNPTGRPKIEGDVRALAQEHGPEAMMRLVGLMSDENPRVAVVACQAVLDRAYGKAPQSVEMTGDMRMQINVSFAD